MTANDNTSFRGTLSDIVQMDMKDRDFIRSLYASEGWTPVNFDNEYKENLRRARAAGMGERIWTI